VQAGQTLTWNIPGQLAFLGKGQFDLFLKAPEAALGSKFPVKVSVSATGQDGKPENNSYTLNVLIARFLYLPMMSR
jgi:hypothetical protein